MPKSCTKCGKTISNYYLIKHEPDLGATIKYIISFCWKCGSFWLSPDIYTKFTMSILENPEKILELIRAKQLKLLPKYKYVGEI